MKKRPPAIGRRLSFKDIQSMGWNPVWNIKLVTEALLSGLDRFGKSKEVLTDQGQQYYSWRGKGAFQKLLDKQGIKHVVARSHHPQTAGLGAAAQKPAIS